MAGELRKILRYHFRSIYQRIHSDTVKVLVNQARILSERNQEKTVSSLEEVEFQVFSQRGEDGIIQYICGKLYIQDKIFIELGVEDYTESNTRLLLVKDNWRGLVVDGNKRDISFIRKDSVYWKHPLTAVHEFITSENIESIVSGFTGGKDPGLLSIDIDGNDYWVWKALERPRPAIVVCEYNALWGPDLPLSIPYRADFQKTKAHYSDLYYGCSLAALVELASEKAYDFIGTNAAGINAFFVRSDLGQVFSQTKLKTNFREALHQDGRDKKGRLNFFKTPEKLKMLKDCRLVHTVTGENKTITEWFGL